MPETRENQAVWLSSFSAPLTLKSLPLPSATEGSAVIKILATIIVPYAKDIHSGKISLNVEPPFVPNPGAIGRVHAVGSDSVHLKQGDLVFVDSTIRARDDPRVIIIQGHHGGNGEEAHKRLMREWRDGSLQQFQKVPLENVFPLDEQRLLGELKYSPVELIALTVYMVAAGAIIEAADLKMGETIVIGPSGGSFGGAAVEVALALGANVIALGRNEKKLKDMKKALGNPHRLQYIATTGNIVEDTTAILGATPGGAGAEVYNDWKPGGMSESPYFAAALGAVKGGGRVICSGGMGGNISIPYGKMLHDNLTVKGKWMYSLDTARQLINMVTAGVLNVGKQSGATVAVYGLNEHHEAVEAAAMNGGWRNYTVITPNQK